MRATEQATAPQSGQAVPSDRRFRHEDEAAAGKQDQEVVEPLDEESLERVMRDCPL